MVTMDELDGTLERDSDRARRRVVGGLLAAAAVGVTGCRAQRAASVAGASVAPTTAAPPTNSPGESAAPSTAAPATTATSTAAEALAPRLTEDRDLHALRRLTYAPTPALVAHVKAGGGWKTYVEAQLTARTPDDVLAEHAVLQSDEVGQRSEQAERTRLAFELVRASLHRQTQSPAQLYEQMVEFWSNHFSIYLLDGQLRYLKPLDDRDVVRAHALGTFRALLQASAHSPAMMVYLDNAESSKGAINENYGRELLELHTVGVGGGYSEADVVGAATVLTGWGADRARGVFRFNAARHDDSPQTVMGWRTPAGVTGEAQGVALLDYLASHPSTAKHLAHKLVLRFVSDPPDQGLVDTVAAAYLAADTDIAGTLRALFNDERFFTTATPRLRRPTEFLVAALRVLDGAVPGTGLQAKPGQVASVRTSLESLGQLPFGWAAPNGYPDVDAAWLNAGALIPRWNMAGDLVSGALPWASTGASWREGIPAPPDQLVPALAERLLGQPGDPKTVAAVSAALATPLDGPAAPTTSARNAKAATAPDPVLVAAALILSTPQFQYR